MVVGVVVLCVSSKVGVRLSCDGAMIGATVVCVSGQSCAADFCACAAGGLCADSSTCRLYFLGRERVCVAALDAADWGRDTYVYVGSAAFV